MLNGFGRRLKSDGTWTAGFWSNGNLHGYAMRVIQKPEIFIELGHYDKHVLLYDSAKDIKVYNADNDIFAQEFDIAKCFKDYNQVRVETIKEKAKEFAARQKLVAKTMRLMKKNSAEFFNKPQML